MNDLQTRLRAFACSLLQYRGALVEWPEQSDSGIAVLPDDLAGQFGGEESLTLTTQPAAAAAGEFSVSLTSSFVDVAEAWLAERPRVAHVRLEQAYLKKSGVEEMVARQFQWLNARVRIAGATPATCDYHHWHLMVQLTSEERWEDLVCVTINAQTGASARIGDPLSEADWRLSGGDGAAARTTAGQAMRRAVAAAQRKSAEFVARLDQRLHRDRDRIEQYYNALLLENRMAKARVHEDAEKRADRRRAVDMEKQRKLLELDERYTLQVSAEPVALVVATMPVLAIQAEVTRKRATAMHRLFWNPVAKTIEPMACTRCGADITTAGFEDETVAPRCVECLGV